MDGGFLFTGIMFLIIPFLVLGVFIFILIKFINNSSKGGVSNSNNIRLKINDGSYPKEQFEELEKRPLENRTLKLDLLTVTRWYGNVGNLTRSLNNNIDADLFSSPDDTSPSAITDMRFYLSYGGFGSESLKRLIGITATKLLNDKIVLTMIDGVFRVYLNNVFIGFVNITEKCILDQNSRKIATIIPPSSLYVSRVDISVAGGLTSGLNTFRPEVSWKVIFGKDKDALLLAQKGNVNPLKQDSSTPIVQISPLLDKNERALVFGLHMFIKVQSLLSPNNRVSRLR